MTDQQLNTIRRVDIAINDHESIEVIEITGVSPGPIVAVIGGIHGDEEEGVLSVRRLGQSLAEQDVKGTVRCLPVANPSAYRARNRVSPIDNKNLAREFPGNSHGSVTERIAHVIRNEVIAGADAMIDLHSAGINYAMPLFCGYFELGTSYSHQSAQIARAFGTPIVWAHTQATEGRTLSAALELGVPAIYAECGGGGQVRGRETDAYVNGLINVFSTLGVLNRKPIVHPSLSLITDTGGDADDAIASPVSGVIVTHVAAGELVKKGGLLFEVYDEQGHVTGAVKSPTDSIVMYIRRTARTEKGEMVAMLARPPEPWLV